MCNNLHKPPSSRELETNNMYLKYIVQYLPTTLTRLKALVKGPKGWVHVTLWRKPLHQFQSKGMGLQSNEWNKSPAPCSWTYTHSNIYFITLFHFFIFFSSPNMDGDAFQPYQGYWITELWYGIPWPIAKAQKVGGIQEAFVFYSEFFKN